MQQKIIKKLFIALLLMAGCVQHPKSDDIYTLILRKNTSPVKTEINEDVSYAVSQWDEVILVKFNHGKREELYHYRSESK